MYNTCIKISGRVGYRPSWLWAEFVWAELVMGRVCHGPRCPVTVACFRNVMINQLSVFDFLITQIVFRI